MCSSDWVLRYFVLDYSEYLISSGRQICSCCIANGSSQLSSNFCKTFKVKFYKNFYSLLPHLRYSALTLMRIQNYKVYGTIHRYIIQYRLPLVVEIFLTRSLNLKNSCVNRLVSALIVMICIVTWLLLLQHQHLRLWCSVLDNVGDYLQITTRHTMLVSWVWLSQFEANNLSLRQLEMNDSPQQVLSSTIFFIVSHNGFYFEVFRDQFILSKLQRLTISFAPLA